MATFELNIYDDHDEVVKRFEADRIRWGTLLSAVKLNEEIKSKPAEEQLLAVSGFVLSIFPGMAKEDLEKVDVRDVLNTFKQVVAYVGKIDTEKAKNS